MAEENKKENTLFSEEKLNFDIFEWLFKILNYWYLFVLAVLVAYGVAFLQNRKWIPQYISSGTMLIKESTGGGYSASIMSGFGVDAGYKNLNNQIIILSSYDLMCRVVDSLPFMKVDYITQGRFKTRNLYHATPIIVEAERVNDYGRLFEVDFNEGLLTISSTDEHMPFTVETHYGELIETPFFTARIWPTERMVSSGKMYFRFRSRDDLVADFSSRLALNFVTEESTILKLSLVSEVPQRDCEFIDMLCKVFLEDNLRRKNEVADRAINFITGQIDNLQQSLSVSEGAMTDFRQRNKFIDVGAYAGTLMSKLSEYDAQNMSLRLRETYLDYLVNYLDNNIDGTGIMAPTTLGVNDGMLSSLVQQMNDLRIQRGELSEKNVYYAKYTKDMENVKTAIYEIVNSMRVSLQIERDDMEQRFAQVQTEVKNLPEKELEMVAIERDYRINDNYYTFFLQKRAETEIQKASNTPDNEVLDKARTLAVTNASQTGKTTTRYIIIGLIIPLILIIFFELINNKVRSPKEAEHLSRFPLIGSVRHAKSDNPTLVKSHPRSSYAEQLRSIRTKIEFTLQRKTGIVVLITSTQSGDGKTFLSSNLAALYAMTGKRTLLIDMDIRKPNIHEKMGIDAGMGLTNYLIGDCDKQDIIVKHPAFDFDIVRAGTIPPNPGELIRSDKLVELLSDFRQKYEYVVIDTSPVGQVPDALSMIEQTDITLFVVRCMQTNRFFARNTLSQLEQNYGDKIQVILSDIPVKRRSLRYGATYGYGYGGYGYGYGGYGYGSNYGYGYGYGSNRYGYGYGYGKKKKDKKHDYYSDDEEV